MGAPNLAPRATKFGSKPARGGAPREDLLALARYAPKQGARERGEIELFRIEIARWSRADLREAARATISPL